MDVLVVACFSFMGVALALGLLALHTRASVLEAEFSLYREMTYRGPQTPTADPLLRIPSKPSQMTEEELNKYLEDLEIKLDLAASPGTTPNGMV